jgi:hypothetical protein
MVLRITSGIFWARGYSSEPSLASVSEHYKPVCCVYALSCLVVRPLGLPHSRIQSSIPIHGLLHPDTRPTAEGIACGSPAAAAGCGWHAETRTAAAWWHAECCGQFLTTRRLSRFGRGSNAEARCTADRSLRLTSRRTGGAC